MRTPARVDPGPFCVAWPSSAAIIYGMNSCKAFKPYPGMYVIIQDPTRVVYTARLISGVWYVTDRGSDTDPAMARALLALLGLYDGQDPRPVGWVS